MRTLQYVAEFKAEAASAVFTKQQAVAVTLQLLAKEQQQADGEDAAVLADAMKKVEFRYIDATKTETDHMLDALSVARFTTNDIVSAIDALLFDVK